MKITWVQVGTTYKSKFYNPYDIDLEPYLELHGSYHEEG